jgi:hypothetical protein
VNTLFASSSVGHLLIWRPINGGEKELLVQDIGVLWIAASVTIKDTANKSKSLIADAEDADGDEIVKPAFRRTQTQEVKEGFE